MLFSFHSICGKSYIITINLQESAVDNKKIADVLDDIGDMLEIMGQSRFRYLAYHRASQVIRSMPRDLEEVRREEGLTSIKGIGSGIAEKLNELLDTGRMGYFEELKKSLPGSLTEMVHIQGIGPKKAKIFYEKLGIETIDQLEEAVAVGKIQEIPGMGVKTEENIERGLEVYRGYEGRLLLNQAIPIAEHIIDYLNRDGLVDNISTAGSLRRWQETIGDIDILAATKRHSEVADKFCTYPETSSVLAKGDTKCSILLHSGLQIDLRMIDPEHYGAALQYFTGSKAHNIHLREIVKKKGLKLSEYGLFRIKDDMNIAAKTEEDIYKALGMTLMEPELREDKGEIEAAIDGSLPHLVKLVDIKGDLHIHTKASDGQSSLEEIADSCQELGYEYACITDHAFDLKVAHGLDVKRFEDQWKEIDELNKAFDNFTLLKGVELNIDNKGGVDFDDDFLGRYDVVLASIHMGFGQSKDQITDRIIAAMENPHIDMVCHPTGRILGRRPPYSINMEKIIEAASLTRTFLELNAFPDRLDLSDDQLRAAKQAGSKIAINTDAHHFYHLAYMRYGLHTAKRGWLEKEDVVNTFTLEKLKKLLVK